MKTGKKCMVMCTDSPTAALHVPPMVEQVTGTKLHYDPSQCLVTLTGWCGYTYWRCHRQRGNGYVISLIDCLTKWLHRSLYHSGPESETIAWLLGMHKIYTIAYHPKGDGLVKKFNHILQACQRVCPAWGLQLQQLLFAYWSRLHTFTGESPFYYFMGVTQGYQLRPFPLDLVVCSRWM